MHPNVKPVTIEVYSPENNLKDLENANKEAKIPQNTDSPILESHLKVIHSIIMKVKKL